MSIIVHFLFGMLGAFIAIIAKEPITFFIGIGCFGYGMGYSFHRISLLS